MLITAIFIVNNDICRCFQNGGVGFSTVHRQTLASWSGQSHKFIVECGINLPKFQILSRQVNFVSLSALNYSNGKFVASSDPTDRSYWLHVSSSSRLSSGVIDDAASMTAAETTISFRNAHHRVQSSESIRYIYDSGNKNIIISWNYGLRRPPDNRIVVMASWRGE